MEEVSGANTAVGVGFPPHNVSPKEKSSHKWHLQGAKAIWYFNDANAPILFYNDRDTYNVYLKYAFGEQDVAKYKPALGVNAKNQEQSFVGGIRWQIKNFATKRVQSTISKVFARKYDPVATAIDPTSIDKRESFKASMKTWAEEQAWLMERQQMLGIDLSPDGVDISNLPSNTDALDILMQDYKLVNEIVTEVGIKYHLKNLDFDQSVKEKFDQFLVMLPAAGVWVGLDQNGIPTVKVLNPSRALVPRSEFNNFRRIAYGAYIDDYTVAEFRALVNGEIPREELDRIIDTYSTKGNYQTKNFNPDYPHVYKDVDVIQVMHYEIATVDEYVFLEKSDKYGNRRLIPKDYGYYRDNPEDFRTKYKGERKIHRVQKPTVYGGYWIVNSDKVFGFGEKPNMRGEVGYKFRATNSVSGYTTCLMKQMIPCLDNLETYDKKIQQLVASAIPNGIKIDLFALRKAAFKFNGKEMTTEDLLQMFFQRGVIITDTSETGVGDARKPLEVFKIGISDDLVKYLEMMRNELEQLDEIIGYNRVSSGSTLSPETGARVAQQMDIATDVNLDHIYRADRDLCARIYECLGYLHRESVMAKPEHYIPILGEEAVMKIVSGYHSDEIGIDVEARPTQEEWNQFYAEINDLVKAGMIEPEDRPALRRFQSLKQAEAYLKVITKRRKQEKQQEQLALIQKNGEVQMTTAEKVLKDNMLIEEEKRKTIELQARLDRENDRIAHENRMREIRLQKELENMGKVAQAEVTADAAVTVARSRPAKSS